MLRLCACWMLDPICARYMQIKMKVEKSKEDKIAEQRRQKLLAFLNSSVE